MSREAISIYKRGEPWPLEVFPYEQILSFGAPLANAYKIAVEGRELLFETQMVSFLSEWAIDFFPPSVSDRGSPSVCR